MINSAIIKKEIKENFFVMKGSLWLFIVALLFSVIALCFVSIQDLSMLAQSDIITTFSKLVIVIGCLITIILAATSFSNEKEQNTLESLLLTTVSKHEIAIGKLISIILMWLAVFILSIPYIIALGEGSSVSVSIIRSVFITGTLIVVIVALIATTLSIILLSSKNAIVTSIILFIIVAVPGFLPKAVIKSSAGSLLGYLSPLSSAFNILKSVATQNVNTSIATTGFYIAILVWVLIGTFIMNYGIKKIEIRGE